MPTPVSDKDICLHCADGRDIRLIRSISVSRVSFDSRYLNSAITDAACLQCSNYGKSWSCPPLNNALTEPYSELQKVRLYVAYIPVAPDTPIDTADSLLAPVKKTMLSYMRDLESKSGGRICGLAGVCELCFNNKGCTRPNGLPCRYPDMIRPSLEALGYNVCMAVKDLTGLDIIWGKEGYLPAYLLLTGAIFT